MKKQWIKIYKNKEYTLSFNSVMGYKICMNNPADRNTSIFIQPEKGTMSRISFQGAYRRAQLQGHMNKMLNNAITALYKHWERIGESLWKAATALRTQDYQEYVQKKHQERRAADLKKIQERQFAVLHTMHEKEAA